MRRVYNHSTMPFLLVFLVLSVPQTCFTQITEETVQTTKSAGHTQQANSTQKTVHDSTPARVHENTSVQTTASVLNTTGLNNDSVVSFTTNTDIGNHGRDFDVTSSNIDHNSSSSGVNETGTSENFKESTPTVSNGLFDTSQLNSVVSPDKQNQTEASSVLHTTETISMASTVSHSGSEPSDVFAVIENKTQSANETTTGTTMTSSDRGNSSATDLTGTLNSSTYTSHPFTDASSQAPHFTESTAFNTMYTTSPENIVFEDFLRLTNENMSACFFKGESLSFHALSGEILFSEERFNRTTTRCYIKFTVPSGMLLDMFISVNESSCYRYYLNVYSEDSSYFSEYKSCSSEPTQMQNYGNTITVRITLFTNASVELFFNFTAVPTPQLEVIYLTNTTGYIQTPNWDGEAEYPSNLDSWARLDVPANFSVMISFVDMDIEAHDSCGYDHLTIYVGDNTVNDSVHLIHCNQKPIIKPTVFHTYVLLFHFQSDAYMEYSGFRLHFSFHNQSETPDKLDNGKWNCSVPYWPQFQRHLNCNLIEECSDGQDEENCTHTNNECGKGLISIGSKCYIFITEEKFITWNEAANECLRREAYLASLNTPREWEEVINFVSEVSKQPVYFGLQKCGPSFPELYRESFQWSDASAVFYAKVRSNYYSSSDCSVFTKNNWYWYDTDTLLTENCDKNMTDSFLCEKDTPQDPQDTLGEVVMNPAEQGQFDEDKYVKCPTGHFTQRFLACDVETACWANQIDFSTLACGFQMTPLPPSFTCLNGVERVPYSLVCDHRSDCSDNSDENFCTFPSCRQSGKFQCTNKQCVANEKRCDRIQHCLDGSDERQCPWYYGMSMNTPIPPAIINFDGYGSYKVKSLDSYANETNTSYTGICPETHFLCPGNLTYCMPVFVRCNGVYDCPGREDEAGCDGYECPGFYRCRASAICVHADHVCDGVFQCPQHDDELQCEFTCPDNCTCLGLAFYCASQFPAGNYEDLRFLDAHGSGLNPDILKSNSMLIYLNLAQCKLKYLSHMKFPNLRILDLSNNELESIQTIQMKNINKLQKLSLAGNPLTSFFETEHEDDISLQFLFLQTLDLSNIILPELNVSILINFPRLVFLNMTRCGTELISGEGFQSLTFLRYLDLSSCPMIYFPTDIFKGLRNLKEVWADNYKLCCPATLPTDFLLTNCHSPSDEISSCDALLRSDFYRVFLSLFAALALIGNLGSFGYRIWANRTGHNLGFNVFVIHLCVSDFLMGVYLAIIGVADRIYQGNYLWNDEVWKESTGCKVAGFLSLLSSEVSAFLICLITFDRFLVLRFPFSNMHFRKKSAHVACLIVWLIGIVLAGIPLLPVTEHWHFYSQNGICIPLPITRNDFAGHDYSFSIIIVVNFVLFLLIAAGQVFIYWSIRTNSMTAGDSNKKSNDLTIARRLFTIAVSDFLCWFPIGLLGLLASSGVPIPGEVNVAIAIIILPVNSAINPFLYTINMLLEKRRRARERRIQKLVMKSLACKYSETAVDRLDDICTKSEAMNMINTWLYEGVLSINNLEKIVFDAQEKEKASENQTE